MAGIPCGKGWIKAGQKCKTPISSHHAAANPSHPRHGDYKAAVASGGSKATSDTGTAKKVSPTAIAATESAKASVEKKAAKTSKGKPTEGKPVKAKASNKAIAVEAELKPVVEKAEAKKRVAAAEKVKAKVEAKKSGQKKQPQKVAPQKEVTNPSVKSGQILTAKEADKIAYSLKSSTLGSEHAALERNYRVQMKAKNWQSPPPPPSAAELAAIHLYTTDKYSVLNPLLRGQDELAKLNIKNSDSIESVKKDTLGISLLINSGLAQLPKHQGDVYAGNTLYRGATLQPADLERYQTGKTVTEKGFVSSTPSLEKAKEFGSSVLFTIKSKTGASIQKYSLHPDESEVLFGTNTQFKVNKRTTKDGVTHIEMEEIPPTTEVEKNVETKKSESKAKAEKPVAESKPKAEKKPRAKKEKPPVEEKPKTEAKAKAEAKGEGVRS